MARTGSRGKTADGGVNGAACAGARERSRCERTAIGHSYAGSTVVAAYSYCRAEADRSARAGSLFHSHGQTGRDGHARIEEALESALSCCGCASEPIVV